MAGFVEIAKIVIKVAFFAIIAGLIGVVLVVPLANLSGILQFLNGLSNAILSVLSLVYSVLFYYSAGAFRYIYLACIAVIITKLTFWSIYWVFQGYKIVTNWLMK